MPAEKDIKREQAKIDGSESKALPFNENEYQDITYTYQPFKNTATKKNKLYEYNRFIRH